MHLNEQVAQRGMVSVWGQPTTERDHELAALIQMPPQPAVHKVHRGCAVGAWQRLSNALFIWFKNIV